MKRDILIISHFNSFFDEPGNSRFIYLLEMLNDEKTNIEVISSSFSHIKKRQRNFDNIDNLNYKLTLIKEPCYRKNISLNRVFSHKIMSRNLKKYLNKRKVPDIIYCSIPSLEVGEVVGEYANKNKVKFIIDIQDLWPEAFKMVFNIPIISNLIYYPMKIKADRIYKMADNIVAVSDTYANRALSVNDNVNNATTVFLGTELESFDKISGYGKIFKDKNIFKVVYVGTLGHSYNIKCIIDSLDVISKSGIKNIEFIVMGDGPLENEFKNYCKNKDVKVNFMGRLEYSEMIKELVKCDIAVNPISKGAAQSIINKVADYAAAGLPVINTQECSEYRNLVCKYKIGFNCNNEDFIDISKKILKLYNDYDLKNKMGDNNRKLAEDVFDRKKSYKKIVEIING
ncbi:glycosyltransferase WbuB [Clostridium perfringens]|uniref:glycosyltransferase family 4 protein n=1 Tax=Clostridium perfringens TaxID=1502 RepID=UPI000F8CF115|nr:glycosyltransferase family 4 protein [Clostridium perfringens]RUR38709.1 glycosyltransferase WbuB [Clostridium perfringens]